MIDIAESARVDTFFSPPFTTAPPELRRGELLSEHLRNVYSRLWHQTHGRREVICSVVLNATVEGPGLVFDRDFNLLRQTIHQATPKEIERAWMSVREHAQAGRIPYQRGVTLLCEKAGIGNYGHWLVEMLPIAALNLRHLAGRKWRLRLPVAGEAMNQVMRDSVELIGVPASQIDLRQAGPQRYEQLVVVHGLTVHGVHYSPLVVECLDRLALTVPEGPARDIWVSRAGDRRSLQDEPAVCAALAERGWLIAEPGRMSLREQIHTFRGARHIAGVTGAGLTNLVFAGAGARITAFMPAAMPDVFFWMLAGFKQQPYREVRCDHQVDGTGEGDWNKRLLIEPSEVLDNLQ